MRVQDGAHAPFTNRASASKSGKPRRRGLVAALSTALVAFAAPAVSAPVYYDTGIRIAVPASADNLNPNGAFTSYDIMWVDGPFVYVADRSNASVDVFSTLTNTFVGRIGGGVVGGPHNEFLGQIPVPPATPVSANSGPQGIVISNLPGQHNIYVGDGNSTLKTYNLDNPNVLNPAAVASARVIGAGFPVDTSFYGGTDQNRRVDEMAFDPKNNRLLVANNTPVTAANTPLPPFATLINTAGNANTIVTKIVFDGAAANIHNAPNALGGLEQSVYDPNAGGDGKGRFYLNVVQFGTSGPGGVVRIDPITGNVDAVYRLDDATIDGHLASTDVCGPAGLALGTGGKLLVGCGAGPSPKAVGSILFDPSALSLKVIPQVSGEDMVWFDPIRKLFFLAARNKPVDGGTALDPVLGIVDDAGNWLQNLHSSIGAHSVAVDPVSGHAFMPFGGFGPGGVTAAQAITCGALGNVGCIAVFALVPEPASLALLSTGLVVLGGLGWRRRRSLDAQAG